LEGNLLFLESHKKNEKRKMEILSYQMKSVGSCWSWRAKKTSKSKTPFLFQGEIKEMKNNDNDKHGAIFQWLKIMTNVCKLHSAFFP